MKTRSQVDLSLNSEHLQKKKLKSKRINLMVSAIGNILILSPNENFKTKCFDALQVSNSVQAEKVLKIKLTVAPKKKQVYQLKKRLCKYSKKMQKKTCLEENILTHDRSCIGNSENVSENNSLAAFRDNPSPKAILTDLRLQTVNTSASTLSDFHQRTSMSGLVFQNRSTNKYYIFSSNEDQPFPTYDLDYEWSDKVNAHSSENQCEINIFNTSSKISTSKKELQIKTSNTNTSSTEDNELLISDILSSEVYSHSPEKFCEFDISSLSSKISTSKKECQNKTIVTNTTETEDNELQISDILFSEVNFHSPDNQSQINISSLSSKISTSKKEQKNEISVINTNKTGDTEPELSSCLSSKVNSHFSENQFGFDISSPFLTKSTSKDDHQNRNTNITESGDDTMETTHFSFSEVNAHSTECMQVFDVANPLSKISQSKKKETNEASVICATERGDNAMQITDVLFSEVNSQTPKNRFGIDISSPFSTKSTFKKDHHNKTRVTNITETEVNGESSDCSINLEPSNDDVINLDLLDLFWPSQPSSKASNASEETLIACEDYQWSD